MCGLCEPTSLSHRSFFDLIYFTRVARQLEENVVCPMHSTSRSDEEDQTVGMAKFE